MTPVYTTDGRHVVFASTRGGGRPNIFWRPADGSGKDEPLTTSPYLQAPHGFSPDGTVLVIREDGPATAVDVRVVSMEPSSLKDGKARSQPLIQSSFNDLAADISPDGHWIAYSSNESGVPQIYVRPFPAVDTGLQQISTEGGVTPAWSHSGRELFYLDSNNVMMAVPVETTSGFKALTPQRLFQGRWFGGQTTRAYDVARNDQRFLMIKDASSDRPSAPATVAVVVNWAEELKQQLATR